LVWASVGTRAFIVLLEGRDGGDPLFLQVKEAQASVLEGLAGEPIHDHHGERVVNGQRLMQAVSVIFLGWHRVVGADGVKRDFYVRQLRDGKGSADIDAMRPRGLATYGEMCGWTLARAHARSGDRVAISAYLGAGPRHDRIRRDLRQPERTRLRSSPSRSRIRRNRGDSRHLRRVRLAQIAPTNQRNACPQDRRGDHQYQGRRIDPELVDGEPSDGSG
jgi:hypothetical protein